MDGGKYSEGDNSTYTVHCAQDNGAPAYATIGVPSGGFATCFGACNSDARCAGFTYSGTDSGNCYLKDHEGGYSSAPSYIISGFRSSQGMSSSTGVVVPTSVTSASAPPASSSASSSSRSCSQLAAQNATYVDTNGAVYQIMCSYDYNDHDVAAAQAASFEACFAICDKTPQCAAFSYLGGSGAGNCYMKSAAVGGASGGSDAAVRVSGGSGSGASSQTSSSPPTSSSSLAVSTASGNGPGTTTSQGMPSSTSFAVTSCSGIAAQGSTYTDVNNRTYEVTCMYDYAGNDLAPMGGTYRDCFGFCDALAGCVAFSFAGSDTGGTCYLKSAALNGAPSGNVNAAKLVSGGSPSASTSSPSLQIYSTASASTLASSTSIVLKTPTASTTAVASSSTASSSASSSPSASKPSQVYTTTVVSINSTSTAPQSSTSSSSSSAASSAMTTLQPPPVYTTTVVVNSTSSAPRSSTSSSTSSTATSSSTTTSQPPQVYTTNVAVMNSTSATTSQVIPTASPPPISSNVTSQYSQTTSATSAAASSTSASSLPNCNNIAPGGMANYTDSSGVQYTVACKHDISGMDLAALSAPNFQACFALCDQNVECEGFSWLANEGPGTCYLKTAITGSPTTSYADVAYISKSGGSGNTSVAAPSSSSSSVAAPPATTTSSSSVAPSAATTSSSSASAPVATGACASLGSTYDGYNVECGTDHYGGDLSAQGVTSFSQCFPICDSLAGCVGFAFTGGSGSGKSSA